jgi:hypothetical protein
MALFLRSKNCDSPLSGATVGYTPINNSMNRRGPIITQSDAAGIAAPADSAGSRTDRTEALLCCLFHFFCRRLPVPMLIYQRWQSLDLSAVCITGMPFTSGGLALFLRSKNCDSPLSGATVGYTPINNSMNRRGPIIAQSDAAGIAAPADSAGLQTDWTEALLCCLFHFFRRRLPVPMLIYQRWQSLDLSSVCITGMPFTCWRLALFALCANCDSRLSGATVGWAALKKE